MVQRFRDFLLSRNSLLPLVCVIGIDVLFLVLATLDYFPQVINVDGLYSAQVARNILNSEGYRTSEMTLYEVGLYRSRGWLQFGPPWPNAGRFPLPVLIRVILFTLFGDNFFIATYFYSISFHVLTIALVYIVGLYFFRNRAASFSAALLFTASPLVILAGINGKETTSDFSLFLLLLGATRWWTTRPQQKVLHLFAIGALVGITYLNRFNLGAINAASFVFLLIMFLRRMKVSSHGIVKLASVFLVGFFMAISPFVAYNFLTFGNPFFSSNALFQTIAFTRPAKLMNPWWKLSYPFDVNDPLSALLLFPGDIILRFLSLITITTYDFLAIGIPGSGYASFWWIPIGVVGYLSLKSRSGTQIIFRSVRPEQLSAANLLWYFLIFQFLVGVPLLGVFTGSAEYFWYLYSILALLAGFGLTLILDLCRRVAQSLPPGRSRWRSMIRPRTWSHRNVGLVLFGGVILSSLVNLLQSPTRIGLNELPLVSLIIFMSGGGFSILRTKPNLAPWVLVLLILITPIVRFGLVGSNGSPEFAPDWITDSDTRVMGIISSMTGPNEIVLSAQPWNVVWWAERPSIAFSEFPDEVYLLMTSYHLNIKAIYIADLTSVFYGDIHAPYTYDAYRRIAAGNFTIEGFVPVYRGFSDGQRSVLLVRNSSFDPAPLLQTGVINFGDIQDSSHLVWGWSNNSIVNGTSAAWVTRPGGVPFPSEPRFETSACSSDFVFIYNRCLPPITYNSSNGTVRTTPADAEVTFLSTNSDSRTMTIRALSPTPNQPMMIVLNSNLLYFGQPGTLLGSYSTQTSWTNITVTIPPGTIHIGVNLINFIFPGYPSPLGPGVQTEKLALFNAITFGQ